MHLLGCIATSGLGAQRPQVCSNVPLAGCWPANAQSDPAMLALQGMTNGEYQRAAQVSRLSVVTGARLLVNKTHSIHLYWMCTLATAPASRAPGASTKANCGSFVCLGAAQQGNRLFCGSSVITSLVPFSFKRDDRHTFNSLCRA